MAQDNVPGNYLGTWKAIPGTQVPKHVFLIYFSKDTIEIQYDTMSYTSAYDLHCAADSCILALVGQKTSNHTFVITPIDWNTFYFNAIENHGHYSDGKNAKPGAIAWAWWDPRPIRFERQQEKP